MAKTMEIALTAGQKIIFSGWLSGILVNGLEPIGPEELR
jgi:hypothetical protein